MANYSKRQPCQITHLSSDTTMSRYNHAKIQPRQLTRQSGQVSLHLPQEEPRPSPKNSTLLSQKIPASVIIQLHHWIYTICQILSFTCASPTWSSQPVHLVRLTWFLTYRRNQVRPTKWNPTSETQVDPVRSEPQVDPPSETKWIH